MPAQIIDGKAIAQIVRNEIKAEVDAIKAKRGEDTVPGLACIIVGTRKDSQTYVRLKHKAAEECGFRSFDIELPESSTQEQLEKAIEDLNTDPFCHGIIVQLPLPPHLKERAAIAKVDPMKDADALLPVNVGVLHSKGETPLFLPCTPAGIMELLHRTGITIAGKRAVVLGRSNIVGMPMAAMLMQEDATVAVVHSATPNSTAEKLIKEADIVVSAIGKPRSVPGELIKEGATVIDVGTTPVDDPTKKAGFRLVGDICFETAVERAAFISPVPGGVGPMTISMLLRNTLAGFKVAIGEST